MVYSNSDGKDTPHEQLKRLLNWRSAMISKSSPFAALDALYAGILKCSPDPALSVKWILASHDAYLRGFSNELPWYKKAILESSPGQTEVVLGSLTALISTTSKPERPAFEIYHKSLTDFLSNKGRSGDLYLERKAVEQFLEERHYQVLKNRGPQGFLPPDCLEQDFACIFRDTLSLWILPSFQYHTSDVTWWIALHGPLEPRQGPNLYSNLSKMAIMIHCQCRWHNCLPACRIWREEILRYLKDIRWPVVNALQLFMTRFRWWRNTGVIRFDEELFKSFEAAQGTQD
ncbi:hypothetical protein NMY22_g19769 [Coprinellus aureogranulatus]|nr:hypothetical protein NMY22_g19769 [Coprinellus aureogranulatus]